MRRVIVDPDRPDEAALDEGARAIEGAGVIALPTDTLYGLAVDPFRAGAVERVFAVKGRAAGYALPLVAADSRQVHERLGALSPFAARLAARFWPGPLTLLVQAPPELAPAVSGGTGKVGVRVPAHAVARLLCRACRIPLTATSANISGAAPSDDPDEIARTLGDRIDLLLDAGRTPGGLPSTIVDATGDTPVLVRAGAIAWARIEACIRATI